MKKTRFIEMLHVICNSNRSRFTDLVNSPYFNKNQRVKLLWDMLDRVIAEEGTGNPHTIEQLHVSEIQILEAIEPDAEKRKKITPANLRMVLSDFVKLGEDFLVLESGAVKETAEETLIEICRQKNLQKSYRKYLRLTHQRCAGEKNKDTAYYNRMYSLECEALINARTPEEQQAALGRISTHTDHMWMCMKLDNFLKLAALGGDCSQLKFYEEIMIYIEKNKSSIRKHHPEIFKRWETAKAYRNNSVQSTTDQVGDRRIFTIVVI